MAWNSTWARHGQVARGAPPLVVLIRASAVVVLQGFAAALLTAAVELWAGVRSIRTATL